LDESSRRPLPAGSGVCSTGRSALIGHTGLVGGNLLRQFSFDEHYNSANISDIAGRQFDLLVCSGVSGTKWKANRDPDADMAAIRALLVPLGQVRAERVILISTVDVFGDSRGADEDSPVDSSRQTPYGRHRHQVEQFAAERFDRLLIVRLPGLFGHGLKKNALYDLSHGHEIEKIDPGAIYQFYWLDHLWPEILLAMSAGLRLVHFATAPLKIGDVAREVFDLTLSDAPRPVAPAHYDFRTRHDAIFGGAGGYLRDAATVLAEIRAFVARERADKP
jgi:hypothetical protein